MRVKTRISSVETVSYNKKCHILLNTDSYVTKLIVLNADESVCHSDVASTLNFIHSKCLVVKGRQIVKKISQKCFICKYNKGKSLLGPAIPCLPDFRVKCNHSFEFVGVVFAGIIYYLVKNSVYKACVLLFTCGVTRSSNIELTIDQSLQSVIHSLRRFTVKTGKTKLLISDNFQTFKFTELNNFIRSSSIEWEFILGFYNGSHPGGEGCTTE